MTQPISLENQRFGHLIALTHEHRAWRCRCVCGQEVAVTYRLLIDGEVTSCGCQPAPLIRRIDKKDRLAVVKAVMDRLDKTPLLTSQALADQLGLSCASIIGVMSHLSRKDLVEWVAVNHKKRQGKCWRLLMSVPEALARFNVRPVAKVVPCFVQVIGQEPGITEEDQQWMTHYRTQYQQRYRRNGQSPPITRFT